MTLPPRVVVVTRPTTYETLIERHATRSQAQFFLQTRGQNLDAVEAQHHEQHRVLHEVSAAIPLAWRRNHVRRAELDRFLFERGDIVVAVGQDGLVANVAKYLDGQPVLGVNPSPAAYEGVLVPFDAATARRRLVPAAHGDVLVETRTMVEARLDDGQTLCALNEIFIGHRSHQSARYELRHGDRSAVHCSSGVVVTTGTGATGWARSITRERGAPPDLPSPTERRLAYLVREAFPSVATSVELTAGVLESDVSLELVSRIHDGGLLFGDGMESDSLRFDWGMRVRLRVADKALNLVLP